MKKQSHISEHNKTLNKDVKKSGKAKEKSGAEKEQLPLKAAEPPIKDDGILGDSTLGDSTLLDEARIREQAGADTAKNLEKLVEENRDSRIVILLSGHSPFMGQTSDIDSAFLFLIMKRFGLKTPKDVRLLFSPASMFPDDQKNYYRGFKEYYAGQFDVKVDFFQFDSAYYLQKIETLLSLMAWMFKHPGAHRSMALTRIGTECLGSTMGNTEYIYKQVNGLPYDQALSRLLDIASGPHFFSEHISLDSTDINDNSEHNIEEFDSVQIHRQLLENVFLRLASDGPKEKGPVIGKYTLTKSFDRAYQFLEDQQSRFTVSARKEYDRNKKIFALINGFYGGGGYTQSLLNSYDRKVGSRDHWHLFKKALDRGVPFMGYSAHAILFSINDHSVIPYNDSNRSADYMNMLLNEYDIVIPRKRDFFTVSPMKGIVPMSIIVHYEREVADLRKFELNYFDESVSEDVMSLRNNCAVVCFVRKDFSAKIMGMWSRVKPPYGDTTSEIRYINYNTGRPCKLKHNEIRTISPNPPLPHLKNN